MRKKKKQKRTHKHGQTVLPADISRKCVKCQSMRKGKGASITAISIGSLLTITCVSFLACFCFVGVWAFLLCFVGLWVPFFFFFFLLLSSSFFFFLLLSSFQLVVQQ